MCSVTRSHSRDSNQRQQRQRTNDKFKPQRHRQKKRPKNPTNWRYRCDHVVQQPILAVIPVTWPLAAAWNTGAVVRPTLPVYLWGLWSVIAVHVDDNFNPQSAASKPYGDYDLWSPSMWMITLSLSQQPASRPGIMIYETPSMWMITLSLSQSVSQPSLDYDLWSPSMWMITFQVIISHVKIIYE
jgi:hypothetical protein